MKILRVMAEGLPLFKEKLDISFYTQQRISEDDKENLYHLFSNIYLNCAEAFIGINASGKTSVLKVILLALDLLNNKPINHMRTKEILGETQKAVLTTFFHLDSKEICKLETEITSEKNETGELHYKIVNEKLWIKSETDVTTKKRLTDFDAYEPVAIRNSEEAFLSDDVSIIIAKNKKQQEKISVVDLLLFTNANFLPYSEDVPSEVIEFLDPTVEYLHFEKENKKTLVHLKFKGKDEIVLNNELDLNQYLSSGTIKGIVTFVFAVAILKTGGYLVVDEVENHFNKEIVATLIRFFLDSKINKNGGTLIFSTHYPELLDEYDRNDSIHIIRNRDGITAENLANLIKRNDIKKSDLYQSGFLDGTTPTYESYKNLKKCITASI